MMHPSMGMGSMMMGARPGMMMDRDMGIMDHGMMMGREGGPSMGMMGPPHDMMMDRGMMDDGMGMMGWH